MRNRAAKRERMRLLVESWRASGQSLARFGRRHGIDPQKLSYWRRVFAAGRLPAGTGGTAAASFVPVVVAEDGPAGTAGIEIVLAAGCRVVVREGVSRALLRDVVTVLREAC